MGTGADVALPLHLVQGTAAGIAFGYSLSPLGLLKQGTLDDWFVERLPTISQANGPNQPDIVIKMHIPCTCLLVYCFRSVTGVVTLQNLCQGDSRRSHRGGNT